MFKNNESTNKQEEGIVVKGLVVVGKTLLTIAVAIIVLLTVVLVIALSDSKKSSQNQTDSAPIEETQAEPAPPETVDEPTPEPVPEPEQQKQIFDTDFGTLEYRSVQDAVGNAVFAFMYTNKTNVTISGYPENLVVNNQFNVQSLGGVSSLSGIDAGNSGAVTFTFGVPTQTTLETVDEITSLSGDFRVYPEDSVTETIGYIHFDVVV